MQEDVATWCRNCLKCQLRKRSQKTARSPLQECVAGAPMDCLGIDIMGPLPQTQTGNRYILVVGDYFSKWMDAWAMIDMETNTIADILVTRVFCLWGLYTYTLIVGHSLNQTCSKNCVHYWVSQRPEQLPTIHRAMG